MAAASAESQSGDENGHREPHTGQYARPKNMPPADILGQRPQFQLYAQPGRKKNTYRFAHHKPQNDTQSQRCQQCSQKLGVDGDASIGQGKNRHNQKGHPRMQHMLQPMQRRIGVFDCTVHLKQRCTLRRCRYTFLIPFLIPR